MNLVRIMFSNSSDTLAERMHATYVVENGRALFLKDIGELRMVGGILTVPLAVATLASLVNMIAHPILGTLMVVFWGSLTVLCYDSICVLKNIDREISSTVRTIITLFSSDKNIVKKALNGTILLGPAFGEVIAEKIQQELEKG